MALAFNTRRIDAVMPFHWSTGPIGISELDPYSNKYQNILAPTSTASPAAVVPLLPGHTLSDPRSGQVFRYVKSTVAVTVGQLLAPAASVALTNALTGLTIDSSNNGTDGVVQAASVTWTAGAYAGDFLSVITGTGPGQAARIVWNTGVTAGTGTLYLDRQLDTALAADSDLVIYRPYSVKLSSTSAGSVVNGVSIGTLTGDGYYGWMQVAGPCAAVLCTAVAITGGEGIHNSATAGSAAVGASASGDVSFGYALVTTSGAAELFPAHLMCM